MYEALLHYAGVVACMQDEMQDETIFNLCYASHDACRKDAMFPYEILDLLLFFCVDLGFQYEVPGSYS